MARRRELTEAEVLERFAGMVSIIMNPPNNRLVKGVCDECGTSGHVQMRATKPGGALRVTAHCEACGV